MHQIPGLAYHPSESLAAPRWDEYIRQDRKTNPWYMGAAKLTREAAIGNLSAREELDRRERPTYRPPNAHMMSNEFLLEQVEAGSQDAFAELDRRTRP